MDLHPIPLCCRQVLPLPTFCGDVGNIIGGTSHPPASHHRGRVYKYSNATGVNFNSVSQQHSARNASPPLRAPPTRKATPTTTATTAADGIGSTQQQQGCHRGNVPPTRTPVPKTATSTTITTDGADSTQQQQDRHSGDAPSSRKTASTTTTADGIDTTRLQQQGCDRTRNSASSSRADPARTRTKTWNATAVELRLQHHSSNDTININGQDLTIIRKKWRSNSNTTDNHGEFYSERGVDNRGKKGEDNWELIRHHPPPGYEKRSASNGHRVSPHRAFNCSRPETDRWVLGRIRWIYGRSRTVSWLDFTASYSLGCAVSQLTALVFTGKARLSIVTNAPVRYKDAQLCCIFPHATECNTYQVAN